MRMKPFAVCVAVIIGTLHLAPAWSAMGRTAASFNVTPTGSATYTIPIFAPPGPHGMQPSMALTYSSDGGIGPLGKGWALSGLTQITRCGKAYAQDSNAGPVALVVGDGYCLNGNRLRLTGGTYGTAGSTYQTEIADFSLVTAVGAAGSGPASFTVKTRDGLIYEYGNSTDSRVLATGASTANVWMVNLISDRAGNQIKFTYKTPDSGTTGTTEPIAIEWAATSLGSGSFTYRMEFDYGSNNSTTTPIGYVAGTKVINDDLLTDVAIKKSGGVVKKYFVAYNTSPTTGAYRVSSVTECSDATGTDCLLPTNITYQNGSIGVSSSSFGTMPTSSAYSGRTQFDFNGDGIKDVVYENGSAIYVAFGSTTGYSTPVYTGISGSTFVPGDIQGTGVDSILAPVSGTWYAFSWNGSSFSSVPTGVTVAASAPTVNLADVDGDGRADMLYLIYSSSTSASVNTRPSTSSSGSVSFGSATSWAFNPSAMGVPATGAGLFGAENSQGSLRKIDFDGDGRDDIALYINYQICQVGPTGQLICQQGVLYSSLISRDGYQYVSTFFGGTSPGGVLLQWQFVDWNSDSCTDVITTSQITISGCNGSIPTTISTPGTALAALDWDGDGRMDLLNVPSGSSTYYVALSTGTGLGSNTDTSIPTSACRAYAADFDGDGLDDIACVQISSSAPYYRHNGAGTTPDLATSFTDGYGVNQTVTYQPATWNYYTKQSGSTAPNKDYAGPMQLVGNVNRTDGIGGTYNQSYWYYGGAVNVQGRGFAGFASRKVTDSRSGTYTIDYFNRDFPYIGGLTKSEAYQSGGILISQKNTTLTYTTLDATSYNQRYFVYPSGGSSYTYEVGGSLNGSLITQTSESRTYDSWGNLTAQSSTVTDKDATSPYFNHSWTQSASSTISPDSSSNWCLNLPSASSMTQSTTTGEPSVTHSKSFTPDYTNCRISAEVTESASSTRRVDTSYGFDSYGNVNSVSVTGKTSTGATMPTRTSYITWGSANGTSGGTGQFPVSVTNALGQTSTRTFHSTFGTLATETDPNGIVVTNNTYDLYGRASKITPTYGPTRLYSYADCASYGCQSGDPAGGSTAIDKLLVIESLRDVSNAVIRTNYLHFDLLDRPIVETYQAGNGGYDRISRQYDALGRVYRQIAPCDNASCTAYWTTNSYDLLGRIISQSRPQSQSISTPQTTTFAYAGRTQTITDPQSKVTTKILDVNGWMRRSQDHNGYYQNFSYDGAGSLKQVSDSLSNTLFTANYSYGIREFQDSTADMDLGARNFYYNSLGELTSLSDAKSQTFTFSYDALSRMTSRTEAEGTTTWTWGASAGSYNIGQLASVSMTGYSQSLSYDNKGRLSTQNITTDQAYAIDYTYNNLGLPDSLTYPTSTASTRVKVKYGYAYGFMNSVTDWTSGSAGTVYWTANIRNHRGQTTRETLGNGVVTNRAIDAVTGWASSIQSGVGGGAGRQNQSYLYDLVGNITQRQESNLGLTENFYYDNLYRLDYSTLNGSTNVDLSYDAMGNILTKTDVAGTGGWSYHSTKKHAVTSTGSGGYSYSYDANGNMISRNGATINWTSYNYPTLLAAGSESTGFYYGPDRQYYKQVYTGPSGTETTNYVGGLLEKVTLPGGTTDWRHYIAAEGHTVAIVSRLSTGINSVNYPLEDHEGSSSVLTNSSGGAVVKESFNPFGLPRNGSTWSGSVPSGDKTLINGLTRRGYTFHSMLGDMGLIHMNGRVQDAVTGRFLSPDPTVPNPGFTQSYNRYSYVNNNPLSFTDPSGFDENGPTYDQCKLAMAQAVCLRSQLPEFAGSGMPTSFMRSGTTMSNQDFNTVRDWANRATAGVPGQNPSGGGGPTAASGPTAAPGDIADSIVKNSETGLIAGETAAKVAPSSRAADAVVAEKLILEPAKKVLDLVKSTVVASQVSDALARGDVKKAAEHVGVQVTEQAMTRAGMLGGEAVCGTVCGAAGAIGGHLLGESDTARAIIGTTLDGIGSAANAVYSPVQQGATSLYNAGREYATPWLQQGADYMRWKH